MVLQLMMLSHFFFVLLVGFALLTDAQDQSGFISIDCGLNTSGYTEGNTGLNYVSDKTFIETGESKQVLEQYRKIQRQYWSLRSFPEGVRNCYKIIVERGTKYLIRAGFLYGNYDEQNMPPAFDLYLGTDFWGSVKLTNSIDPIAMEIIHVVQKNYVNVCLVKTKYGIPFISALELRPLNNASYQSQAGSSLASYESRHDIGSNRPYRYSEDVLDRFWYVLYEPDSCRNISTSRTIEYSSEDVYKMPSAVMRTACTPINANDSLDIWWEPSDSTLKYYVFFHFAEIEELKANQKRMFEILYNGQQFKEPFSPEYLSRLTVYNKRPLTGERHNFSFSKTQNSTLPPIINALEIYSVKEFLQAETDQQDVDSIEKVKSTYGLKKNWHGDPCLPKEFSWEGLNCSYDDLNPPRIISLNLSSSKLTGEVAPSIQNLTMIQTLDLSNNNFTGPVPEFLSLLPKLSFLNLDNNKLEGSLPPKLVEKWKNDLLSLSVNENPNLWLCGSILSCKKKKNIVVLVVASVVGAFILILSIAAIWWGLKRHRQQPGSPEAKSTVPYGSFESSNRQFTYSEIVRITNNFERILGKGGFGTVYRGYIDNPRRAVAVKMLSPSSLQGFHQFHAEVTLLLRVHHRNLTSLVGYCNEQNSSALVYEYMANGNLQSHLSDDHSSNILKWEGRLRIAIDAAQGLEYLHYGCKPPIIHRDVKCTNILLNENFQAKLSDFGLSKIFPTDYASHVSTIVAGTPGYLDPEYYMSNRLNEKSDVYSFGVVLLEIITGRPAISKTNNILINQWVDLILKKGEIKSIIDPRLQGNFNVNSAWKAVEIAMNCVSQSSPERPTMNQVAVELKECLEISLVSAKETQSREVTPLNWINDELSGPLPR
ncbi:hypothetical protein UlMin_045926 [Ulmus minor]